MRDYREITVEDPETGLAGYLVIDATDKAMSFGGTRVDPSVTRGMVAELAENMSLKLAVHGSPVGGAKAGVRASPEDPRLLPFLHRFADACRDVLTTTTILGKDMGARQWMIDEIYQTLDMPQLGLARRLHPSRSCPDRLSELDGYIGNMTGQGVFWAIEEAVDGSLQGARVVIQGFGVVGAGVAWYLARAGARIIAVSDRDKAVFDHDGLDLDAVIAARDGDGLLAADRLPGACVLTGRDALLVEPADVLVLAAGSYLVDPDLARRIRTPVVVEGANLAVMQEARSVLHGRTIRVVPDVVANSASAALVCHQIASGNARRSHELWAEIEARIKRTTELVEQVALALDVDSKTAVRHVVAAAGTPAGN